MYISLIFEDLFFSLNCLETQSNYKFSIPAFEGSRKLCLGYLSYNPPALLLPTVLVNIIVIVVYFYPRLRIRYPEFILVLLMVSEARYKTLHSTSHRNLSERVGEVDTALSYEPEDRGFESRFVFYFFLTPFSCFFLDIAQMFKAT